VPEKVRRESGAAGWGGGLLVALDHPCLPALPIRRGLPQDV
jgi:hypothetical protein